MKKIFLTILFSFFLIVCFLISKMFSESNFFILQSKDEQFGQSYNDKRLALGIPLLPDDWYTKDTSFLPKSSYFRFRFWVVSNYWSTQTWSDFNSSKTKKVYHRDKEIHRLINEIDSEIDRFVKVENDSTESIVEIRYSYLQKKDSAFNASLIKIINTPEDYRVESIDITLNKADSILNLWDIKH
jgi:hypothetical protein